MKKYISIIIIILMIGIGSAQNYMPESTMEPGADLSMFSGDPGNVEMASGNVNNATYINSTYGRYGDPAWSELSPLTSSIGSENVSDDTFRYGMLTLIHSNAIIGIANVISGGYVREILASDFIGYGWGYTSWISDRSVNGSGQHCGFYSRVEGNNNGSSQLWGFATEVLDFEGDETSPRNLIGAEILTVKKNATGTSIGIDVRCDGTQKQTAGVRVASTNNGYGGTSAFEDGIHIDSGIATRGINVSASCPVGIDMSLGTFSNDAIRMKYDQKLAYVATGNCYSWYNSAASAFEIVFPDTQKVLFRTSAGTIVGYVDATGFHNGAP